MSAFKQFLASDVIVTPFEVNKGFSFTYSEFPNDDVQINKLTGVNGDFLTNQSQSGVPGVDDTLYEVLVYNSIKELFYSNYLTSSTGDIPSTASLVPGADEEGNVLVGPSSSQGRYENYLPSKLNTIRSLDTDPDAQIGILSIPSRLYGDYIQPNSLVIEFTETTGTPSQIRVVDDGEGNITYDNIVVGNVMYEQGLVVFSVSGSGSEPPFGSGDVYGIAQYGQNIYGGAYWIKDAFCASTHVTCSFSSSYALYETQYKATIRESEFNYSQNPTIIKNNTTGSLQDFATGSYFQPYVTTVGLYDDFQNLLAVGKLSQPYPLSRTTDTSIFINIDR